MAFCHCTIAAAEGIAVEDAGADPRFAGTPLVVGAPNIRSYLCAPLRTPDGYQVGALCIIGNKVRRCSLQDREILRRFSDVVLAQMELRQIASRDALTGVLSRRAFDQALFEACEAGRDAGGGAAAVAILDIDRFTRINDCHGYGCGDATLVAVTAAVMGALGPGAVIGRLGGEEFGVIIASGNSADVATAAEGLRAIVAGARVPDRDLVVTCSIGFAVLQPTMTSAEASLHAADMALYAAKANGRDCVVMA